MPPVPRRSDRISEALLFAALVLVPLAASPRFSDQFTSMKWHLLAALAACWFARREVRSARVVVSRWSSRASGPRGPRSAAARARGEPAEGPRLGHPSRLLARATFVTARARAFWCFRRTGLGLASVRAAILPRPQSSSLSGSCSSPGSSRLPWLTSERPPIGHLRQREHGGPVRRAVRRRPARRATPPPAAARRLAGRDRGRRRRRLRLPRRLAVGRPRPRRGPPDGRPPSAA